ncbi:MAG: hypothetical protein AAGF85_10210 [Bacteroidota bacterium]
MDNEEFYIGWQEGAASGYKKARKWFFISSILLLVMFGITYLLVEQKFVESYFDYGNLTELTGQIVDYPVFGVKTEQHGEIMTVPLVGFGKFDALPVLEEIRNRSNGKRFTEIEVTLRGTVIYNKTKMWMELTEGNESIVAISEREFSDQNISQRGSQTIAGEIVDPKCFFGVMNPAYNKIHRSCAIRCISGGIPPVLAIRDGERYSDYYFVTDEKGEPINEAVLQFVGTPVKLSGAVEKVDDWKVIKVSSPFMSTIQYNYTTEITHCLSYK